MQVDIMEMGGIPDGISSNTQVFKNAIEEVAKEGGRVMVPDGIWLTGPIELKSNVELHLSDNAVILFDKSKEEYPLIETDYEGIRRIRTLSPIYAKNAENVSITGGGTFDGSGHLWRPVKQFKMTDRQWDALLKDSSYVIDSKEGGVWMPTESSFLGREAGEYEPGDENALEKAAPFYDFYRPVMVQIHHCKNVRIEGVRIQNSPAWAIHLLFCEDVVVQKVSVNNPYYAQNGDGIDVESCRNVEIAYCDFHVGDDGICLKSGKNAEARKTLGPCENVHIHHCFVGESHGGFVVGSEMSRGVRNVLVEDCTFINADVGVRFKSALGRGGVVENIKMKRINMVNIKEQAFIFTMDYVHNIMDYIVEDELSNDDSDIPYFREIEATECNCIHVNMGVKVMGLKDKADTIKDIVFKDCIFKAKKPNEMEFCQNVLIL